ncbi:MAG: zinc ABC transporter substrate-binding protein [Halanaerobium sp.]|nr:zinc ABC transporter substrate-binding protein [Halanaerobium sp.]
MRKLTIILLSLILVVALAWFIQSGLLSSKPGGVETEQGRLHIMASIYPLYFLASRVAGDLAEIEQLVPNGVEIHNYQPTPRKLARLEGADAFIYNGLGLEPWAEKVVANIAAEDQVLRASGVVTLLREDDNHKEAGYDPHIWLDPQNARAIAKAISDLLGRLDQKNKGLYENNYLELANEISRLDHDYRQGLSHRENQVILVSHAAFGYLAHRYGFRQLSVTGTTPHQEPTPARLAQLFEAAHSNNLKYIFLETLASPRTVQTLAEEAGLQVLTLNTVAGLTEENVEEQADYFTLMRDNLENLRKALVEG